MMARQWYYKKYGQEFGPVGTTTLKHLALSGRIGPSTLVWWDGPTDWIEARTIDGLVFRQTGDASSLPGGEALSIDDGSQQQSPAFWNPQAVGAWSLLFTWAFGAFILARNWKAIGEKARANRAMLWFYAIFPYFTFVFAAPAEWVPDGMLSYATLGITLAWWRFSVNPQTHYLRRHFGDDYRRRSLLVPLATGGVVMSLFAVWFTWMVFFRVGDPIAVVKRNSLSRYPHIRIGEAVDGLLVKPEWQAVHADESIYVLASGNLQAEETTRVLLEFEIEGRRFRLSKIIHDGNVLHGDDVRIFLDRMYGVEESNPD